MTAPDAPPSRPWAKTARRNGFRALRVLALVYIVILLILMIFENRLVYPGAYQNSSPADFEYRADEFEIISYRAEDGPMLRGHLCRRNDALPILFLHGNGTKAVWSRDFAIRLADATKCSVMAAEYRGFDNDWTKISESGVIADCVAAFDALTVGLSVPQQQVALYGSSLGGGCAAGVAAARSVRAIILERTFDSLTNVAADKYPFLPVRHLMRNRYESDRYLQDFRGPVLQIHGGVDQVVPIKRAERLSRRLATPDHQFWNISRLGHNDRIPDDLLDRVGKWLGDR